MFVLCLTFFSLFQLYKSIRHKKFFCFQNPVLAAGGMSIQQSQQSLKTRNFCGLSDNPSDPKGPLLTRFCHKSTTNNGKMTQSLFQFKSRVNNRHVAEYNKKRLKQFLVDLILKKCQ